MIEKIAANFVNQIIEAELTSKNMADQYIYVSICWMEKILTIGSIILISIAVQKFIPTLLFLVFFLELRKRTGGYHLNKFYQCYFATIVSYLLILFLSTYFADYPQLLLIILTLAIVEILIIGTVNHPNMHMDSEELAESKKKARTIALLEGSIIYFCALFGANTLFISYMAIAVILCAVLLCISKIFKQEVKESEEN